MSKIKLRPLDDRVVVKLRKPKRQRLGYCVARLSQGEASASEVGRAWQAFGQRKSRHFVGSGWRRCDLRSMVEVRSS